MKKILFFAIFVLSLTTLAAPFAHAEEASVTAEQLRSKMESALKSKDTNAVLALYNWDRVTEEMKSLLMRGVINEMLRGTFTNTIQLAPLPDHPQGVDYESQGYHYFPNIPIVGTMNIDVMLELGGETKLHTFHLLYGNKDGRFYFPGYIKEKITGPALKQFAISVNGEMGDTFTGSYVFVKRGEDIEKKFSGRLNSLTTFVQCDLIKSCTIKKTSGSNKLMKLEISDGQKTIFERSDKDTIVYESGK